MVAASSETEERTRSVEHLVRQTFDHTPAGLAIIAVGGYGRSELFPYSDVDLLLLTREPPDAALRASISESLKQLWDGGLRVGHSVHTAAECCELHEGNLELTISLLDARFVCGEKDLNQELAAKFPAFLARESSTIVSGLVRATEERHAKYNGTIYHLEPNIKEHPGGLRDLQTIRWLARLRSVAAPPLEPEREHLFHLRTFLHNYFHRDNNLLSFEAQDALSNDPAAAMRAYYRVARTVDANLAQSIEASQARTGGMLRQFRDWRARISNSEFTVSRERVFLRHPAQLAAEPDLIMRLLQFIARHNVRLSADTEERLRSVPSFTVSWRELRELLALPAAALALRAMSATKLLQAIVPEWAHIDALVVRDFYHRYTVDEHTLVAIETLELLSGSKHPVERRFTDLLGELHRPDILKFSLLLHDIGKGGGDHVAASLLIARDVLERLKVPDGDRRDVLFLIEHHLALSSIMNSRDLDDPATARLIADEAGTVERLRLLTLLTFADISAVNPAAMSPWRMEQLWRVYTHGYEELTRELESDRIGASQQDLALAAFTEGFPTRYSKTHTEQEIRRHAELEATARNTGLAIDLLKPNGTYRLTVIAADKPFLFASLCGVLASFGFNIVKAEAFANKRGTVLDTFSFTDPHRTIDQNPSEADRVRDTVSRAVAGKLDIGKLLAKRPQTHLPSRSAIIQPRVSIRNDVSETASLVEVLAQDRPGLLFDLANTISSRGANIEVVLIDTEAHKAVDVFYVTANGAQLTEEEKMQLTEALLQVCRSKV